MHVLAGVARACGLLGFHFSEVAYLAAAPSRCCAATAGSPGAAARAMSESATPQLYCAAWLHSRSRPAAS